MVRVGLGRAWNVDSRISMLVPLRARTVWGQMRDVARFATRDPFHARFIAARRLIDAGTRFRLVHRFGPFCLVRCGRILRWCEGRSYAFSDLSTRGHDVGFPHVYEYAVEPVDSCMSRLQIRVLGRWTATWLPRGLVRAWIYTVMHMTQASVRIELCMWERASRHRKSIVPRGRPEGAKET